MQRAYQPFGEGGGARHADSARRWAPWAGAAIAASCAAYLALSEVSPLTGRRRLLLLSAERERALGDAALQAVVRRAGGQGRLLPPASAATRRVHAVARRVVRSAKATLREAGQGRALDGLRWTFVVVDSPQVNAFALPNGAVVVYTGLLQRFSDDSELATILAHEVAHVVCRHAAEKISYHSAISLGVGVATNFLNMGAGWAHGLAQLALELPFSRECELEADAVGLRVMSRACFDPSAAPRSMARLDALVAGARGGGGAAASAGDYLSTHPPSAARVAALRDAQPLAQQVYEEAGCARKSQQWRMAMRDEGLL